MSSASVHVAVFLSVSSAIGAGCGGMEGRDTLRNIVCR